MYECTCMSVLNKIMYICVYEGTCTCACICRYMCACWGRGRWVGVCIKFAY